MIGSSIIGWWSPKDLSRAIDNLLSNALKYGDPSKTITVNITEYKERVTISVHNEGNPIPVAEQEAIFQVYRRAQAARQGRVQGWGIGLPLVRGIAESHGGSIDLESTKEFGTAFTISIPRDARPFVDAPTTEGG